MSKIIVDWKNFFMILWIMAVTNTFVNSWNMLFDWYLGTIAGVLGIIFCVLLVWIASVKDFGDKK